MEFSRLGCSNIDVSRVCLGSMTWGLQNNQHDADEQINFSISQGINFIDTAEMYAVPPSPETYGKTEEIIGNWLQRHQEKRKDIVIASKIAGAGLKWIREGAPITGQALIEAVDNSLQRLNTDYIDVYQLHWPNRPFPHFSRHWPNQISFSALDKEQEIENMLDILNGLNTCINDGKIKHWGLSNETPWGVNRYITLAEQHALAKPVSIQNEFNLLHANDWPYLIENCVNEEIAYLPWSPLASGMLTGKYLNNARPEGSRWTLMQRQGLFRDTVQSNMAVAEYAALAEKHNISPSRLALAWVNHVDGVTSTIIGATTMQQLKENILAITTPLDEEILHDVSNIHKKYPITF